MRAGTITGGASGSVTMVNVESVSVGGTFGARMTANDSGNALYSGAGDSTLTGGAGNDTLWGGNGNGIFNGGAGSDEIRGGAGHDT
jgi:Ca2+-binding RTX toxin-like protein